MDDLHEEKNHKDNHRQANVLHSAGSLSLPPILPESLNNFMALSESLTHYIEQNQRVFGQLAEMTGIYRSIDTHLLSEAVKIASTQIRLIDYSKILSSPVLEIASSINQSLERLLAVDAKQISEMLVQTTTLSNVWKEQLRQLDGIAENLRRYDLIWRSHVIDVSRFSILSETLMSRISWEYVGDILAIQDTIRDSIQRVFLDFSRSYSILFGSIERQPTFLVALPPIVSRLPAVEFFNGTNVIDVITTARTEKDPELEEERQETSEEVRRETEDRLEILLAELSQELVTPLQGARQTIESDNPDRIRHFATSLRELFTHVLHLLAPDDKVKEWSTDLTYYDRGRPTRRARLLYICRVLNHEPFSMFVEKDIDTVLAFLQLFQQGTHKATPKYSDFQLRIMLTRMESTLRFLLEIWRAD